MLSLSVALAIAGLVGSARADYFRTHVDCSAFMRDMVDPIVSPGTNSTHLHTFFGSDAISRTTNSSDELRAGCTSCSQQDFSSYWLPTLYFVIDEGKTRVPVEVKLRAYYAGAPEYNGVPVNPLPQGMRMVTGNAFATNSSDAEQVGVNWYCDGEEDGGKTKGQATWEFPDRCCKMWMKGNIGFPQFVKQLDDGSWTWSRSAQEGYMRIPYIRLMVQYRMAGQYDMTKGYLELSSGPSYTYHADFFNGWREAQTQELVTQNPADYPEGGEFFLNKSIIADVDPTKCENSTAKFRLVDIDGAARKSLYSSLAGLATPSAVPSITSAVIAQTTSIVPGSSVSPTSSITSVQPSSVAPIATSCAHGINPEQVTVTVTVTETERCASTGRARRHNNHAHRGMHAHHDGFF